MKQTETACLDMVAIQIINRGIKDTKVIAAMQKVPRHKFVSKDFFSEAYNDHPLPIGAGQTISQPYMVALMLQCLKLSGNERVLEIGTGSGYQTAILSEIVKEIYTIERIAVLAKTAKKVLDELNYKNINIKIGDGTLGWENASPFDKIIVTAGAKNIPAPLIKQLTEDGELIIPLGDRFMQTLTLVKKQGSQLKKQSFSGCVFVPLIGRDGWGA